MPPRKKAVAPPPEGQESALTDVSQKPAPRRRGPNKPKVPPPDGQEAPIPTGPKPAPRRRGPNKPKVTFADPAPETLPSVAKEAEGDGVHELQKGFEATSLSQNPVPEAVPGRGRGRGRGRGIAVKGPRYTALGQAPLPKEPKPGSEVKKSRVKKPPAVPKWYGNPKLDGTDKNAIPEARKKSKELARITNHKTLKSKAPRWYDGDSNLNYSKVPPESEFGRKCVERWGLTAPYDLSIGDEVWKLYWDERTELEHANTRGTELYDKTFFNGEEDTYMRVDQLKELVNHLVKYVWREGMKDKKTGMVTGRDDVTPKDAEKIATALGKSVYFMGFEGEEGLDGANRVEKGECNPVTIKAKTRMYSPFGIGSSVDFAYFWHAHKRNAQEIYEGGVAVAFPRPPARLGLPSIPTEYNTRRTKWPNPRPPPSGFIPLKCEAEIEYGRFFKQTHKGGLKPFSMPADEKVEKNENAEVEGEDDGKEEGFTGVEEEVEEVVEFEVSGKLKGKGKKKKVEIKVAGVQLFYFTIENNLREKPPAEHGIPYHGCLSQKPLKELVEQVLFGTKDWLSPRHTMNLLLAASGAGAFQEQPLSEPLIDTIASLKFFKTENDSDFLGREDLYPGTHLWDRSVGVCDRVIGEGGERFGWWPKDGGMGGGYDDAMDLDGGMGGHDDEGMDLDEMGGGDDGGMDLDE